MRDIILAQISHSVEWLFLYLEVIILLINVGGDEYRKTRPVEMYSLTWMRINN